MSGEEPGEPPLGPREALERIRTVARAGWRSNDAEEMRRNFEMILTLVDKALLRKRKV
jgi:hypothetical protein